MGVTPTYLLPYPEDADPADVPLDMKELAERIEAVLGTLQVGVPQTGDMKIAGYTVNVGSEPAGWLLCDGRAVSRATYSALFAKIGTNYGAGDGATSFNLPDTRGRVVSGRDAAQTEFNPLGKSGGAKTHAITLLEMPVHDHGGNTGGGYVTGGAAPAGHTSTDGSHTHSMPAEFALTNGLTTGLGSGGTLRFLVTSHQGSTQANGSHEHTVAVDNHSHTIPGLSILSQGSGTPTSLLQPYVTANYLIRT